MIKVVVVGMGEQYRNNRFILNKYFNVVVVLDRSICKEQIVDDVKMNNTRNIALYEFDKAIICSDKYATEIANELSDLGIDKSKIETLAFLDEYWEKEDVEKFEKDRHKYQILQAQNDDRRFNLTDELSPILCDYRHDAGLVDGHYFFQDVFIASRIIEKKTKLHYDVGSRIDGLISHLLSAGVEVHEIDIRKLQSIDMQHGIGKLVFERSDATFLNEIPNNSIESISSCHAIEHFGLGRYGDDINPNAWKYALQTLQRVLKNNGCLYLSLPVGKKEKIIFNELRIFDPKTIVAEMPHLDLEKMYLIHDCEIFEYDKKEIEEGKYNEIIGEYDCGMFIFNK